MGEVVVYSAVSLDGFLAAEGDDLSWLPHAEADVVATAGTVGFAALMERTGAMLMGRRTFDVVQSMGAWPYGDTPVLVATTRELTGGPPSARAARGEIAALCRTAQELAGQRDVYLDGGTLISAALDAGCVDRLILTVVPVLLGKGVPLYAGAERPTFDLSVLGRLGQMLQVELVPRASAAAADPRGRSSLRSDRRAHPSSA